MKASGSAGLCCYEALVGAARGDRRRRRTGLPGWAGGPPGAQLTDLPLAEGPGLPGGDSTTATCPGAGIPPAISGLSGHLAPVCGSRKEVAEPGLSLSCPVAICLPPCDIPLSHTANAVLFCSGLSLPVGTESALWALPHPPLTPRPCHSCHLTSALARTPGCADLGTTRQGPVPGLKVAGLCLPTC